MVDFYHYDDVQEILSRAIALQARTDDLSRGQLIEIASELGISAEVLQLAEQEWLSQKGELQERQVFNLQRRQEFKNHLVRYGIVNAFLVILVVITPLPSVFVGGFATVWGLRLSLQGWSAYQTRTAKYEAQFQKWRRRRLLQRSFNNMVNRFLGA
jgi:nitrate reductase NapE component